MFWKAADRASRWNDRSSKSDTGNEAEIRVKNETQIATVGGGRLTLVGMRHKMPVRVRNELYHVYKEFSLEHVSKLARVSPRALPLEPRISKRYISREQKSTRKTLAE